MGTQEISLKKKISFKKESQIFRKKADFPKVRKFPSQRNPKFSGKKMKFSGKETISPNSGNFLQKGISNFQESFESQIFRKGDDFNKLRKFPSKRNLKFSGKEMISPNLG